MASTTAFRRNSVYGHSGVTTNQSSAKTRSPMVRRTQSMRFVQKQNINNTISPSLKQNRKLNSINGIVVLDNVRLMNGDCKNGNKSPTKTNGKTNENAFNFIIAKNLEHFKNEKVCRVLIVGAPDTGKTSLVSQFCSFLEEQRQTNQYLEKLNPSSQFLILYFREIISLDHCFPRSPITMYQPDAYIILYAVNDRESFESAKELIKEIQKWDDCDSKPMILVANKTDLVRSRTVTKQEGRQLAMSNNCKYIETSCAISHNIEFLLQGIGAQIQLKCNQISKQVNNSARKPNLFKRLLRKAAMSKSKSCDNLHVL